MAKALVWFRNDLRLHDNKAVRKAAGFEQVIPVYVLNSHHFSETDFGFPKTAPIARGFFWKLLKICGQLAQT